MCCYGIGYPFQFITSSYFGLNMKEVEKPANKMT